MKALRIHQPGGPEGLVFEGPRAELRTTPSWYLWEDGDRRVYPYHGWRLWSTGTRLGSLATVIPVHAAGFLPRRHPGFSPQSRLRA